MKERVGAKCVCELESALYRKGVLLFEEKKDSKAEVSVARPSAPLLPSERLKLAGKKLGARLSSRPPLGCSYLQETFSAFRNATICY